MVIRLSEELEVPLRERNETAARRRVRARIRRAEPRRRRDDGGARAIDRFLRAHEPYPAVVVDRHHNLISANDALDLLLVGVNPDLLAPPANGMRVALHPEGMAPRTLNLAEWSAHLLHRVRREAQTTGDPELQALYAELASYPGVAPAAPHTEVQAADIVLPLRMRDTDGKGELAFISTLSTFLTASDVTLSELAIEAFYPANAHTAMRLMREVAPASGRLSSSPNMSATVARTSRTFSSCGMSPTRPVGKQPGHHRAERAGHPHACRCGQLGVGQQPPDLPLDVVVGCLVTLGPLQRLHRALIALMHLHQLPVVVDRRDEPVEQTWPGSSARLAVRERIQRAQQLLAQGVQAQVQLEQDVRLALEVVVERRLGEPEALGDVADRRLVVALLGEQLERDVEDPFAGRDRLVLSRRGRGGGGRRSH